MTIPKYALIYSLFQEAIAYIENGNDNQPWWLAPYMKNLTFKLL